MDIGKELRVIVIDEEQVIPEPIRAEPNQINEDRRSAETTVD